LSLIPYFITISVATCVATSISLLAPVEISSKAIFSAALPPNNTSTHTRYRAVCEYS